MNVPYLVIGLLITMDIIGVAFGIYGLGSAKGWWK